MPIRVRRTARGYEKLAWHYLAWDYYDRETDGSHDPFEELELEGDPRVLFDDDPCPWWCRCERCRSDAESDYLEEMLDRWAEEDEAIANEREADEEWRRWWENSPWQRAEVLAA